MKTSRVNEMKRKGRREIVTDCELCGLRGEVKGKEIRTKDESLERSGDNLSVFCSVVGQVDAVSSMSVDARRRRNSHLATDGVRDSLALPFLNSDLPQDLNTPTGRSSPIAPPPVAAFNKANSAGVNPES